MAGDGACLFRALAVSFMHAFFGISRLPAALETLAAAWLRYAAVHAVWGGAAAVRRAERRQRSSLPHALFNIARAARGMRAPPPPLRAPHELAGAPTPDAALVEGGVPVREAIAPASHERYCRTMLAGRAWGSDTEISALFAVLRLRVEVWDGRGAALLHAHGAPDATAALRVAWSGGHYDALVVASAPLLTLPA